jgi:hypothetical protein
LTHGRGRLKPYTTNPTHPTQACTSHHTCSPVESASDRKAVSQTGFQAPVPAPRTADPSGGKAVRSAYGAVVTATQDKHTLPASASKCVWGRVCGASSSGRAENRADPDASWVSCALKKRTDALAKIQSCPTSQAATPTHATRLPASRPAPHNPRSDGPPHRP